MDIVKIEDLNKATLFSHKRYLIVLKWIMKGAKLNDLNQLYKEQFSSNPDEFISNIFEVLNIKTSYFQKELENIPQTGSFIAFANHPLGIIDGLIFISLLRKRRKDIKILANDLLSRVEPLNDLIIPVDLFGDKKAISKNVTGLKMMNNHLSKDSGGVLIFPAGEVSTIYDGRVQDKIWKKSVVKLIIKPKVSLIPIYFNSQNSLSFHLKGKINEQWRTLSLVNEMYNKKHQSIQVRIGKAIKIEQLNALSSIDEKQKFLRAKIYGLSNPKKETITEQIIQKIKFKPSKIVPETHYYLLREEINDLSKEHLIIENGDFQLYLTKEQECPNVVNEIGRLREITFRSVGEGSGKSIDIDGFDLYYHHLFIWDKANNNIVGGYRIGFGNEIIQEYGKSGLYSNKLFKYKKEFVPTLERSIELGRSFIRPEYQKKPIILMMLWQGILELLIRNNTYRYLIGPVSISNDFSTISKEIMILYLKSQYYDYNNAKYVKARKPFKIKYNDISKTLLNFQNNSIKEVDSLIQELEPFDLKIPILLKKYLNQNAQFIGFNTDPKFNNCLDGLILLDFAMLPPQTIRKFSKKDPYLIFQRQNAFYFENSIQI